MRRFPRAQRAIAAVLREARQSAGLSARALAQLLGVPHNYIARIESMERHVSAAEFMVIARTLKVRPATLMARAEKRARAGAEA